MKKYDEASVVRALSKNVDVNITTNGNHKFVEVVKGSQNVGNGTWGKIDYLTKHCKYVLHFVDINARIAARQAVRDAKQQAKREARHARKTNAVEGMVKAANKVLKMRK